MRPTTFSADTIIALLRNQTIASLAEVMAALGAGASRRTAFRKLNDIDARTSYSHRGGYYTLDELTHFDERGRWSLAGIRFSRAGTLIATAESFVNDAEAGHFVDELDNLLGVGTQDALRCDSAPIRCSVPTGSGSLVLVNKLVGAIAALPAAAQVSGAPVDNPRQPGPQSRRPTAIPDEQVLGSAPALMSAPRPKRHAPNESRYCSVKWTVTDMTTGTGTPFSKVGVYRHCRTASTAASSSSGTDRSTCTCSTEPVAPTTVSRITTPSTRIRRAAAG